ncbi:hypothetical protein AWT69_004913 [Pseudomonas putida]|nr:hypothetical protein AWT69_004913 [Pseudomonas putida]
MTDTDCWKILHSTDFSPILYGNNKPLLSLYCRGHEGACFLHGIN